MASWLYPLAVNKNVGDTVYLTATGSGSAAPSPIYTATFRQTNGSGTITSTGALTATYLVVTADSGKVITFYAKVTDNCSTPKTSPEVPDTATIAAECVNLTCQFMLS